MNPAWRRCSKSLICPICDRPDWCGISADGALAHCMRIASDWTCRKGGWFHKLSDPKPIAAPRPWHKPPEREAVLDVAALFSKWGTPSPARLEELSSALGVTVAALASLGAAWATEFAAWAFPMSNAAGTWTGVRLRNMDGKKWAVRGSRSGLFLPARWSFVGPLVIVEGPTDAAAVIDLGFDVIGRPSCNDGDDLIASILKGFKRDVVILANLDEPKARPDGGVFYPGQDGAESLADLIVWRCPTLKVITPPAGIKDARKWLGEGGTRADVLAMVASKRQWRPTKKRTA
jgi:hypothetical protein